MVTAGTDELHRRVGLAEREVTQRVSTYLTLRLQLVRRLRAEEDHLRMPTTLLRDVQADRMVATSAAELVQAATFLHRAQQELRSVEEQAGPVLAGTPRRLRRLRAAADRMERRAARVRIKALQRHPGAARRGRVRR